MLVCIMIFLCVSEVKFYFTVNVLCSICGVINDTTTTTNNNNNSDNNNNWAFGLLVTC